MEALALLLNIPPSKTLLRRHLATHFHLLIGSEAQRQKQECLENPDYSVLTATARVKVRARPPETPRVTRRVDRPLKAAGSLRLQLRTLFCQESIRIFPLFLKLSLDVCPLAVSAR